MRAPPAGGCGTGGCFVQGCRSGFNGTAWSQWGRRPAIEEPLPASERPEPKRFSTLHTRRARGPPMLPPHTVSRDGHRTRSMLIRGLPALKLTRILFCGFPHGATLKLGHSKLCRLTAQPTVGQSVTLQNKFWPTMCAPHCLKTSFLPNILLASYIQISTAWVGLEHPADPVACTPIPLKQDPPPATLFKV